MTFFVVSRSGRYDRIQIRQKGSDPDLLKIEKKDYVPLAGLATMVEVLKFSDLRLDSEFSSKN